MTVLAASLIDIQGHPVLELQTDQGTAFVEEPKAEPLAWGYAVLTGPAAIGSTAVLPADVANGRPDPLEIHGCTADAVAVSLARRFFLGELEPGAIELPAFEAADAERWAFQGGTLVRK